MSSRTLAFLLFSAFLLISLEVVVAGSTTKDEKKDEIDEQQVGEVKGAWGCRFGCCGSLDNKMKCTKCCHPTQEDPKESAAAEKRTQQEEGVDEPQQLSCRHGCCLQGPRKICRRCCRPHDANSTINVEVAEETEGVGEAKAGRCIRGCCAWGSRGCLRCCKAAEVAHEETKKVEEEVNPEADASLRCRYGCCMKGRYGCVRCCRPKHPPTQEERSEAVEEVAEEANLEAEAVLRCRYGCCMIGRYGCLRCCRPKNPPQAEESVAAGETEAEKPGN